MNQAVSGLKRTPLHEHLYAQLSEQITSGRFAEGEQLPPELELASQYGVSRGTVRQAIARLSAEGLVERTAGRGTFVSSRRLVYAARELLGFSAQIRASGRVPSSRVIGVEVVDASAQEYGTVFGDLVQQLLSITRVRQADGEPIALEHLLLPFPRFAGLRDLNLEDRSIYDTLEAVFGVQLTLGQFSLDIADLDDAQAALLGEKKDSAAFAMSGCVRDQLGLAVVSVRSLYRRDHFSFTFSTPRDTHQSLQYAQPRLVIAPVE